SSRRRHTSSKRDWSSDVCSSDLGEELLPWCADRIEVLSREPFWADSIDRALHKRDGQRIVVPEVVIIVKLVLGLECLQGDRHPFVQGADIAHRQCRVVHGGREHEVVDHDGDIRTGGDRKFAEGEGVLRRPTLLFGSFDRSGSCKPLATSHWGHPIDCSWLESIWCDSVAS